MDDYTQKLVLKSELKLKMPSQLFREIIDDSQINNESLGKFELVDLLFEKYSLEEIKNMILRKYEEHERYSNKKMRLLKRLDEKSIDEKVRDKRKKEKNKRRKGYSPKGFDFYSSMLAQQEAGRESMCYVIESLRFSG